eukprot:gene11161-13187_t
MRANLAQTFMDNVTAPADSVLLVTPAMSTVSTNSTSAVGARAAEDAEVVSELSERVRGADLAAEFAETIEEAREGAVEEEYRLHQARMASLNAMRMAHVEVNLHQRPEHVVFTPRSSRAAPPSPTLSAAERDNEQRHSGEGGDLVANSGPITGRSLVQTTRVARLKHLKCQEMYKRLTLEG